MNMRGKLNIAQFGPMTLPEYEAAISNFAKELNVEVEYFHSNIEGEVINRLYKEHDERRAQGIIINPSGYTMGYRALNQAINQVNGEGKNIPIVEVHVSNTAAKGTVSEVTPHCLGTVAGFGVFGYKLALQALLNHIGKK